MTDLETAIMIKNMARETVRRMSAKVKNATRFKYGDKVTVDGKYEGVVQAVKDGYYEVRIFDGSRVVGTKVCYPEDVTARNAAKNAEAPQFDGSGHLLDKNGKPFFVYNDTTAGLIIRKYKEMGVNLKAEKDRIGNVYFKRV